MKVGDAAQTTAAVGATVKPVKNLNVFGTWRYYDNLYGTFSINSNYIITSTNTPVANSLKAPSYNLTDIGASYTINVKNGSKFILTGNVYNLFDTVYISDLRSSIFVTSKTKGVYKGLDTANSVYFGFGRTWAASVSYRF